MAKKEKENLTADGKTINCMVFEPGRGRYLGHLDSPPGNPRRYGKQELYLVLKDGSSVCPIEPSKGLDNPPAKLFRALHCWSQSGSILFTMRNTALEIAKVFGLYILAGVLILALYLLSQGGK